MTVKDLLDIVNKNKGKISKTSYVRCSLSDNSTASNINIDCCGMATWKPNSKNGLTFFIGDNDNIMDDVKYFDHIKSNSQALMYFIKRKEPYLLSNFEFVSTLLRYENQMSIKNINLSRLNVDLDAYPVERMGYNCELEDLEIDNSGLITLIVKCDEQD